MALTATIKIVVRRGTLAQWNAANPILLQGEIGFITDKNQFVIGNGVDSFVVLYSGEKNIYTNQYNIKSWFGEATDAGQLLSFNALSGKYEAVDAGLDGQVLTYNTFAPQGVQWTNVGTGDMLKSVYDTDENGIVDASEREQIAVINKTGATLSKGTIVYLKSTSSSSNYPEVLKASATTESTSSKTIGGIYEDIPDGEVGYVVTSGQVHNLNTSAYPIGTKLWLSTTPGEVTSTPPVQPNHTVFIGTVTRSQTNNGRVLYAIQNGYEIDELHNVKITSVQNGDILKYNSALSLWVNTPKNDWQIDYNDYYEYFIDGNNLYFPTTFDYIDNSLRLYMNGLRLSKGATNDYVETFGSGFKMNYPPELGDILIAEYIKK